MKTKFKELINDPFYYEYRKYDRCVLDYSILDPDIYLGEITHREAIIYSMKSLSDEKIEINDLKSELIETELFFQIPTNYKEERHHFKTSDYHRPYWYLFLYPPYETGYKIDDFIKLNNILFPNGKDKLEIYDWNVDWSTYFEDGLEWWGARCTSIYDKSLKRFVIIFASATD